MQISQVIRRKKVIAISALAVLIASFGIYFWLDVSGTFKSVSEKLSNADRVQVERTALASPGVAGINLILNHSSVRAMTVFNGKRFVATSGGLAVINDDG
ncbi:MAG TPA: hypothetical protein VFC63_11230, partial [Blastocatellia bacterium]|nr:hypothetical protein [Blastocatellia bacterium]